MPKLLDLNQVLAIIKAGTFDDLLGAVEGEQLECKSQHYRLDDDHEKFELAKDVSAFANAKGGAILIGVKTARDTTLAADIIRKIGSFPKSRANISQYRDVLKDWIYPNLQKLDIEWFPSAAKSSEGIVAIAIGNQGQLWRPFVITRTVENSGKMSTVLFGYTERSLDRSAPMGIQQLHLLLRDGLRFGTAGSGMSLPPPLTSTLPTTAPGDKETREKLIRGLLQERIQAAIDAVQLSTRPAFVLAASPLQSTEIQGLFSSRDDDVVRLLEDPKPLRPSGFGPDAGSNSRIVAEGQARRTMIAGYKLLEIWTDGFVVFVADGGADFLSWANKATNRLTINQLALIEATYVFVKFANDVLAKADPRPHTVLYRLGLRRMTIQEPAILFPGPLTRFSRGEQQAPGPDKDFDVSTSIGTDSRVIAFKFVAQVYRWFGFDEVYIPYTEQTTSGERIISPDQIIDQNKRGIII